MIGNLCTYNTLGTVTDKKMPLADIRKRPSLKLGRNTPTFTKSMGMLFEAFRECHNVLLKLRHPLFYRCAGHILQTFLSCNRLAPLYLRAFRTNPLCLHFVDLILRSRNDPDHGFSPCLWYINRADHTMKTEGTQKILIIVGPTASGKTALAIELAKKLDGEVVSADSRQVYRGLDIGTGKVTKREMECIPHHLLDVASPKKAFTADDFVTRAERAIVDISKRGKLPIIAGGTGFYIDALVGRITLPDVPPNPALRKKLHPKTAEKLYALLKKKDPARAASMDTPSERNNKVRLIRALEIAEALGINPTPSAQGQKYNTLWVGINPPLKALEQKISQRLSQRLKIGMIAEAKRLHAGGLSYKRMEALGLEYRSLARFLQGKITRTEMEAELGRDIRRYAKHQLSYWKRNTEIKWIKPSQSNTALRHIRQWID